jgi:hypothetical protein
MARFSDLPIQLMLRSTPSLDHFSEDTRDTRNYARSDIVTAEHNDTLWYIKRARFEDVGRIALHLGGTRGIIAFF